jgi:AIR synthase-related protein
VNGDDAAALASEGGYTLFAAEGMRSEFVAADPWFAGFCSLLVNVNDIAAMGGRPWAVVDVLFLGEEGADRVLEGIVAASELLGVPVVGGHTTRVRGSTQLAVAVLGRARELIRGDGAAAGQTLVAALDLRGAFRGTGGNFNAATTAPAARARAALALLPELAEAGLVRAGKDISMAGTCGTLLMLLEASGVGAVLDLDRLPAPPDVEALRWLTAFPSYGFLLAVAPSAVDQVIARFDAVGVSAAAVGQIDATRRLELRSGAERETYWDLSDGPLTGFGP